VKKLFASPGFMVMLVALNAGSAVADMATGSPGYAVIWFGFAIFFLHGIPAKETTDS
jgi:hypothetical protein